MTTLPISWKLKLAQLARNPVGHRLMLWGIYLIVPRQRVGAAVVVLDDNGRVLLLYHVFHPFTPWGLPGGWLKRNEDPAAGALRELKEETGLTAVIGPVLHVSHAAHPQHLGIVYAAQVLPGKITVSDEIIEARWFEPEKLPQPLLPFTQLSIETALRQRQERQRQQIETEDV